LGDVHLPNAYQKIHAAIEQAIIVEKARFTSKGLTYSHNTYFKSAKSRYDLDSLMGFIESSPLH